VSSLAENEKPAAREGLAPAMGSVLRRRETGSLRGESVSIAGGGGPAPAAAGC